MDVSSADPDLYEAIAARPRRQILELLLRRRQCAVGELVDSLQLPQPAVSKHLKVLREAGLVTVDKQGQRRLYQLHARKLKAVQDWIRLFEEYWSGQVDRIRLRAEQKARERQDSSSSTSETGGE